MAGRTRREGIETRRLPRSQGVHSSTLSHSLTLPRTLPGHIFLVVDCCWCFCCSPDVSAGILVCWHEQAIPERCGASVSTHDRVPARVLLCSPGQHSEADFSRHFGILPLDYYHAAVEPRQWLFPHVSPLPSLAPRDFKLSKARRTGRMVSFLFMTWKVQVTKRVITSHHPHVYILLASQAVPDLFDRQAPCLLCLRRPIGLREH